MRYKYIILVAVAVVVGLDQWTKLAAVGELTTLLDALPPDRRSPLFTGPAAAGRLRPTTPPNGGGDFRALLEARHTENQGAAWGPQNLSPACAGPTHHHRLRGADRRLLLPAEGKARGTVDAFALALVLGGARQLSDRLARVQYRSDAH